MVARVLTVVNLRDLNDRGQLKERIVKAKRIFVLNGHPAKTSLSAQFAASYAEAATDAGYEVRMMDLNKLDFDSDFGFGGYSETKPLEAHLAKALENLRWSEHVVLLTPLWWGGLPAKLKGLIDRILLPGTAFDPRQIKSGFPTPLLTIRTARVILTSDTPDWYFRVAYRYALIRQLRSQIFGFVGIKPTRFTHFSPASHPTSEIVEAWSKVVAKLGTKGA